MKDECLPSGLLLLGPLIGPQGSKRNGSEHRPMRTAKTGAEQGPPYPSPISYSLSELALHVNWKYYCGSGDPIHKGKLANIWNLGSGPHI